MKRGGTRSLRTRLATDFALLTLVLVLVGGAALFHYYKNHSRHDLDEKLLGTLQLLRLSCVIGEDGPVVTLPDETKRMAAPFGEGLFWFMIRRADGQMIYRGSDVIPMPDFPMLNGTMAGPVFADLTLPDGHPVRVAGQFISPPHRSGTGTLGGPNQEVHLTVAASRQLELSHLREVGRTIFLSGALVLVVLTGLAAWIIKRALQPLQSLSYEIARFPVGAPGRFSAPRKAAELEPVVDRLNDLMERVGSTLKRERGFAMGAAHELRTPLAGLRARLELALSRRRTAEEYRSELHEALEIERGLESMVNHLLLLARLGQDGTQAFVTKSITLSKLLRQSWGEFFDRAEARELRVSIRAIDGPAELHSSEDMLALVIRNLFDNAVSHTPIGGQIKIASAPTAQGYEITVSNTNPGVLEQDLARLVEPFWRARHEEAAQDGRHAGLGLALCQRIIEELGGTLTHVLVSPDLICARLELPLQLPS